MKPISFEQGGGMRAQTIAVLQAMTTKLAEDGGGEINAATALRRLRWKRRLNMKHTLNKTEADSLNAASANEERMGARKFYRAMCEVPLTLTVGAGKTCPRCCSV